MAKLEKLDEKLANFKWVAQSIWKYQPSNEHLEPGCKDPALVILCAWTGAQSRHIAKYIKWYQENFKSTHIMLLKTTAKDLCFRSSGEKQKRLTPAIKFINKNVQAYKERGVLVHAFSEGGSNKACELATAFKALTNEPLPVSALCLDSTPGCPRFRRLCKALYKSLPPTFRQVGFIPCSAVLGGIWIYALLTGFENNVIHRTRACLLDFELFGPSIPRLYLYSKRDKIITWTDIETHIGELKRQGLEPDRILFENSAHVSHLRDKVQGQQYWPAVEAMWSKACDIARKAAANP